MRHGDKVEILVDAGALDDCQGARFVEAVKAGTIGTFDGPHANKRLKGWFMVRVEREGRPLFVPLSPNMFKAVES